METRRVVIFNVDKYLLVLDKREFFGGGGNIFYFDFGSGFRGKNTCKNLLSFIFKFCEFELC